jgi:hypothetical protein
MGPRDSWGQASLRYTARTSMSRVRTAASLVFASLIGLAGAGLSAGEWPQYLGMNRDGVYQGVPLADAWPSGGPRVLWKKPVGEGFSGPVVAA